MGPFGGPFFWWNETQRFDAYASYKPISNVTVLFGVQNLFDRNPPFTNASQNNFAADYSETLTNPLGRTFYLNLKYDFL